MYSVFHDDGFSYTIGNWTRDMPRFPENPDYYQEQDKQIYWWQKRYPEFADGRIYKKFTSIEALRKWEHDHPEYFI